MTTTPTRTERSGTRPGAGRPPRRAWQAIVWLRGGGRWDWLRRKVVGTWMNVLIAVPVVATVVVAGFLGEQRWPERSTWGAGALKLFALWCLAFLPGWLYVRFLSMRATALWSEYVLTLHRLGWDQPWHLPEPPPSSDFHDGWLRGGAFHASPEDNIYRQKFEAYYGRQVASAGLRSSPRAVAPRPDGHHVVATESLFPLFLATAVLAVGWAAVLWDTRFLVEPAGVWDALKYGFLGAYAWVTGMLVRRFFQSDLRPSAYATAVFRIALVLLVVGVLHQLVQPTGAAAVRAEVAVAFLIGFFPLVGLQVIERVAAKALRVVVPPLTSDHPLDQLDGLNLWYEARLTEEGVEDMQNLATMNLVDVVLHTRVPPGRLVDWLDQAFLLLRLNRDDRAELRRVGIRTASDLLKTFSKEGRAGVRLFARPPGLDRLPLPETQLRLLVQVLAAEPGLAPVWNWQRHGVPLRDRPTRQPAAGEGPRAAAGADTV